MSSDNQDHPTPVSKFTNAAKQKLDLKDPEEKKLYEVYRPESVTPHQRGVELLHSADLNKVGF
jgi:hypothetical protein